eukprot:s5178_g2.t3
MKLAKSQTRLSAAALAFASKGCSSASAHMRRAKRIEEKAELRPVRIFLTLSSNYRPKQRWRVNSHFQEVIRVSMAAARCGRRVAAWHEDWMGWSGHFAHRWSPEGDSGMA